MPIIVGMNPPPILTESTPRHLRGLLELLRVQRFEQEPDVLLGRTAEILAESLGFRAVVVHLYRPRCDAFQVVAAHGSDEVRERLLDSTTTLDAWTPLLDDRFEHGGVSFIPHGELGRSELGTVNVPATRVVDAVDARHPEAVLLAPLRGADGSLLGILSLHDRESGALPGEEELEVLATVAAHVALSIDAARAAAAAARDRASLVNLLEVSARLTELETVDSVLSAVTHGIQQAFGFEKAVAAISDGAGGFVPGGAAGWSMDDPALDFSIRAGEVQALLDPDYEIEGCFLLPREIACARAAAFELCLCPQRPRPERLEPALADRAARRPSGRPPGIHLGGRPRGLAAALARAPPGPAHVREPGERCATRGGRPRDVDPAQ